MSPTETGTCAYTDGLEENDPVLRDTIHSEKTAITRTAATARSAYRVRDTVLPGARPSSTTTPIPGSAGRGPTGRR